MTVSPLKSTSLLKAGQVFVYRENMDHDEYYEKIAKTISRTDKNKACRAFGIDVKSFFSPEKIVLKNTKKVLAIPVWVIRTTTVQPKHELLNPSFNDISPVTEEFNKSTSQNSLSIRPEEYIQLQVKRLWATPDLNKVFIATIPTYDMDSSIREKIRSNCNAVFDNMDYFSRMNEIGLEDRENLDRSILKFFLTEIECHDLLLATNTKKFLFALNNCGNDNYGYYMQAIREYRQIESECSRLKSQLEEVRLRKSIVRNRMKNRVQFAFDLPEIKETFIKGGVKCV